MVGSIAIVYFVFFYSLLYTYYFMCVTLCDMRADCCTEFPYDIKYFNYINNYYFRSNPSGAKRTWMQIKVT